jgi:hypothetical protein
MGDVLTPGQKMQIPSVQFNDLIIVNESSFSLDVTPTHNNIMNPVIVISDAAKKEGTEGDKAIKERLKSLEGMEMGN